MRKANILLAMMIMVSCQRQSAWQFSDQTINLEGINFWIEKRGNNDFLVNSDHGNVLGIFDIGGDAIPRFTPYNTNKFYYILGHDVISFTMLVDPNVVEARYSIRVLFQDSKFRLEAFLKSSLITPSLED